MNKKQLIILAGPTAVGKTKLSIELARHYNADIFSADSRQIYQEMSIGTAKPSTEEMEGVTHHFIHEISITEPYSVGDYLRAMDERLKEYYKTNDIAILSGGTGLYIKAILEGINEFPKVSQETIDHYENILETEGIAPLQEELSIKDPEYFDKIDQDNPARIIRALSVIGSSDHNYSYFINREIERKLYFNPIKIVLLRDREELYKRIEQRIDIMLEDGLEKEVQDLYPMREQRALNTVGYSEFFKYLDHEIDRDEAIRLLKRNTRRYAKRQMTWFRNQDDFTAFHPDDKNSIIQYIDQQL